MELAVKTSAVILSRKPLREHDASLVVFSKTNGKMHLTAMGLYKPAAKLSSSLIPGNVVYLTLSKGMRWHITGAKLSSAYAHSFFEPRVLYLSSIVRELMLELFPYEEEHADVFERLKDCFAMLASRKYPLHAKELIVYRFMLSQFDAQGLLPDFTRCARERRTLLDEEPRYWTQELGILCNACRQKERGTALSLPLSLAAVTGYTTADRLSAEERSSITTMLQDIYSNDHLAPLKSLSAWMQSMVRTA